VGKDSTSTVWGTANKAKLVQRIYSHESLVLTRSFSNKLHTVGTLFFYLQHRLNQSKKHNFSIQTMDNGHRKYSNKSTYKKTQNEDNGADFTVLKAAKNPY
jgi:hypothetical protein